MRNKPVLLLWLLSFLFISVCTLKVEGIASIDHEERLRQLNAQVVNASQQGRYQQSIILAEEAYHYALKHLGKEHPGTLVFMNNLAGLYNSRGLYSEAEPLYKETLQLREKVLGREHPYTLTLMNSLAGLYESQGRYSEAELLYKETLQLREKVLGREHPNTLTSMNNLAMLYESQGRYSEAEPLYKETLQLSEKALGREHPYTLTLMSNLAVLYCYQGRYSEAEPLYKETLQLREKVLGKEHPGTLTSMNNLATLYESQGRYSEAEPLFKQALQLREKVLGKEHPDTLISMNSLAGLYKSQGRYSEAEPLLKQALQLSEKVLGREHPSTFAFMNNLAELCRYQGHYSEAEPLYKEVLQLCEKVLGREHPNTLTSMDNLATLYKYQGRYGEAEPLYREALQLSEKVLGRKHPETLASINNLAELYYLQGRYSEAELLYKETLQLSEKVLGREHPKTLVSINNLATLYISQGRYGEAEPLMREILQLREKVQGKEHPNTLRFMNNLATLYECQGRYGKAEPLLKQVLQLNKKVLGREHPDTLASMNSLAMLYCSQGRYGEAEPLMRENLQLCEKVLGREHPKTLVSINNLAMLYKSQGCYSEAEPLLKQALQLNKKVLGMEHPGTLASMNNLAFLYCSQGRYGEAEPLMRETLQLSEKVLGREHPNTLKTQLNYVYLLVNEQRIQPAFRLLKQMENRLLSRSFQELYGTYTERVRRLYLKTISNFQDVVFTLAQKYPTEEHIRFAANVVLRWKQVYADETAFQHRFLYVSHDPDVERLRDTIKGLRAKVSWMVYHPANRDIQPIRDKLRKAEAELREKVKVYRSGLLVTSASIDQILGRMPDDSGLIEFRMYSPVDFKTGKYGNTHWAAYLLLSDIEAKKQVFFADLGEVEGTFSGAKASHLYQRLLGNFDAQINGLKRLYIAPDGPLNLVSFSSLLLPDGRYLVQRQEVDRLQTGRDFLRPAPVKSSNILVAVGGVDYDKPMADKAAKENGKAGDSIRTAAAYPNQRASRELGRLNYLKCSRKEVARIALLYERNCKGGKALVYQGNDATENRLKTMKHAPRILHLSTHGFYLSSEKMDEWATEEPLALSGLALAGANHGLSGLVDRDTDDDGLLCSLEILSLDLQGTELVSLSACDTGKGVVDYSEGVYGLVRAFRTAGARSVLMTLYPVDDYEARDFMIKFYEIWLSSKDNPSPAQALHRTRLYFINQTSKPKYKDPGMWSPYVMVGG